MGTLSMTDGVGILFALMTFVVTFTVARMLRGVIKRRRAAKAEIKEREGQSRQVRRAGQRKARNPR